MNRAITSLGVVFLVLLMSQACFAEEEKGSFVPVEAKIDGEVKHFMLDTGAGDYYELRSVTDDSGSKRYYLVLIPRFGSEDKESSFIEDKVKEKIWRAKPEK